MVSVHLTLHTGGSDGAIFIAVAVPVIFVKQAGRFPGGEYAQDKGLERLGAYVADLGLAGEDGAVPDVKQAGAVGGTIPGVGLAAALYPFAGPGVDPGAGGEIDLIAEDADAEVVTEHILIAHVVYVTVVREHQRHGPDNGQALQGAFQRRGIDVGHQVVTKLHIVAVHVLLRLVVVEGLHHREPAVDLDPGQEKAEMQALHLEFGRDAHHVAREVHVGAVAQVELVEEGGLAAAVVAAGGGAPVLGARPAGGVVVPDALACVGAGHAVHLLLEQDLVEIVHLLVRQPVVIGGVRMLVDGAGRIHLEAFHAVVQEGRQMVHPMLLPGLRPAFARRDLVFFRDAQVIFLAEPETQVEAHVAQLADEEAVVQFLGILVLDPVRFGGELLEVPFLLRGEIVALLHPLRLQPEHVAGDLGLAEENRIVQDVPLVLAHVGTEAEAVGPFGQDVIAAGHGGVAAQQLLHRRGGEEIEVRFVTGVVDVEMLGIGVGDVEEVLARGVVVHGPACRAHHEGHRDLGMLISRPHTEQFAAMLDVLAAGAAAAVETLVLGEGETQQAGLGGIPALAIVDAFLAVVLVSDDAVVLRHVQVGVGVVDDLREGAHARVTLAGNEVQGLHQHGSVRPDKAEGAFLLVDGEPVSVRGERPGLRVAGDLLTGRGPVRPDEAVALHQGFGEVLARTDADAVDAVGAGFHADVGTRLGLDTVSRIGLSAEAEEHGSGKKKGFQALDHFSAFQVSLTKVRIIARIRKNRRTHEKRGVALPVTPLQELRRSARSGCQRSSGCPASHAQAWQASSCWQGR